MNLCSDYSIKGCPASAYLDCPAYQQNKNCWEYEGSKQCCKATTAEECGSCPVRIAAERMMAVAENWSKNM